MRLFNQTELKSFAAECARKVRAVRETADYSDQPFKHFQIDNFFPEELAAQCLENFPPIDAATWEHANDADIEIKQRTTWQSEFDIPEGIVAAVRLLNSADFMTAMSDTLSIPKIVADPYFTGGGLNATLQGGLLDVHVDGNYHDATGLNRRINALVYLNPGWQPEWGGDFGLYDDKGEKLIKKIAPIYNRLVVFESHDYSFHGLPDPLNFPKGQARRSIILYYYTKEARPSHQIAVEEPHSALWKKRDLLDKRGSKVRAAT